MVNQKDFRKRSIFLTFWKLHCVTKSLFFELETSNFGCLLILSFRWAVLIFSKIWQHWYYTFYKGPPFEFVVDYKIKKDQSGDPYLISSLFICYFTIYCLSLHSSSSIEFNLTVFEFVITLFMPSNLIKIRCFQILLTLYDFQSSAIS